MRARSFVIVTLAMLLAACETDPIQNTPAPVPTPSPPAEMPLPDVTPPGPFVADSTHYPLNEACHYSCPDSIINRWRPHFAALGFSVGHADMSVNPVANGALGHVYEWWAANRCGGYVAQRVDLRPLPSTPDGYPARGDVMHDPLSEPVVQVLYRRAAALPRCPSAEEDTNEGLVGGS